MPTQAQRGHGGRFQRPYTALLRDLITATRGLEAISRRILERLNAEPELKPFFFEPAGLFQGTAPVQVEGGGGPRDIDRDLVDDPTFGGAGGLTGDSFG